MTRFEKKVWLSSPTMHGDEIRYVTEAYETNWMSTVGANINEVERLAAEKVGCKYAVALSAGTAALPYIAGGITDVGADIFARGLCLPSDNKMTPEQQDAIIQTIRGCFE